jgi:hypothetical protein
MEEQLRIILIIIVSVSIFGLLVFVFVRNHIRNVVNHLVKEDKKKTLAKTIQLEKFVHDKLESTRHKMSCKEWC